MVYTEEEAVHFSKIRRDMFAARHELRCFSDNVLRTPNTPLPEGYKSSGDILDAALPREAEQDKFWAWSDNGDRLSQASSKVTTTVSDVTTAPEYFEAFSRTNYINPKSIHDLCSLLASPVHPYIPVGSYKGYRYRLVPCSTILESMFPCGGYNSALENKVAEPIPVRNRPPRPIRTRASKVSRTTT
jgi:hypothetical protein